MCLELLGRIPNTKDKIKTKTQETKHEKQYQITTQQKGTNKKKQANRNKIKRTKRRVNEPRKRKARCENGDQDSVAQREARRFAGRSTRGPPSTLIKIKRPMADGRW